MKKIFATTILALVMTVNFIPEIEAKDLPCTKWVPTGELAKIPFHFDCSETHGDIGIARADGIYWCQEIADRLDAKYPNLSHFYYVHEYGHYIKGSDELETDCWAAKKLAGTCHIPIAVAHFMDYADVHKPGYGYMRDRAKNIQKCANNR